MNLILPFCITYIARQLHRPSIRVSYSETKLLFIYSLV